MESARATFSPGRIPVSSIGRPFIESFTRRELPRRFPSAGPVEPRRCSVPLSGPPGRRSWPTRNQPIAVRKAARDASIEAAKKKKREDEAKRRAEKVKTVASSQRQQAKAQLKTAGGKTTKPAESLLVFSTASPQIIKGYSSIFSSICMHEFLRVPFPSLSPISWVIPRATDTTGTKGSGGSGTATSVS